MSPINGKISVISSTDDTADQQGAIATHTPGRQSRQVDLGVELLTPGELAAAHSAITSLGIRH
jgi:hypothetical protein